MFQFVEAGDTRYYSMPLVDLKNTSTGEVEEFFISISEKERMIESGEWTQVHRDLASNQIVTHVGGTLSKTSDGWKDLLGSIKKGSGRGCTIKT